MKKKVAAFYGKVRIPTLGHRHVIDKMKLYKWANNCDIHVGLSGTSKPLTQENQLKYARTLFTTDVEVVPGGIIAYLKHLYDWGYSDLTLFCGDDRADNYQDLLETYNGGNDFNFSTWKIEPVNRDTINVSSTKLENFARVNDYVGFMFYYDGIDRTWVKELYNEVKDSIQ